MRPRVAGDLSLLRDRVRPVWAFWVAGVVLWAAAATPGAAVAQVCAAVDAEVEALARGGAPEVLIEIASDLGPRGLSALIVRAESGDATAVLALGLGGQADALRALREKRIPRTPARSLALLALGDASETGTVTRALLGPGSPTDRAQVARYLGLIRAVRARDVLELALVDPEPLVRLEAAKPLAKIRYPKARRALAELARTGPPAIRAQAAEAGARAPTGPAEDLMEELEGDSSGTPGADAGIKDKDPSAAPAPLTVARGRLSGADGEALRAAIRLLEQSSARGEVGALLAVARRPDVSAETRAAALGAALRLCPK